MANVASAVLFLVIGFVIGAAIGGTIGAGIGGIAGFAGGGAVGTQAGIVETSEYVANNTDALIVKQENGDITLYVPRRGQEPGYDYVLIANNTTVERNNISIAIDEDRSNQSRNQAISDIPLHTVRTSLSIECGRAGAGF